MYKVNYVLAINSNSKTASTRTLVWFNFYHEIAPQERKEIEKRIGAIENHEPIYRYLKKVEKLERVYDPGDSGRWTLRVVDKNRRFNIRDSNFLSRKLGFTLCIESNCNLSLEKLIDLDKLNDFVLTGEIKKPTFF